MARNAAANPIPRTAFTTRWSTFRLPIKFYHESDPGVDASAHETRPNRDKRESPPFIRSTPQGSDYFHRIVYFFGAAFFGAGRRTGVVSFGSPVTLALSTLNLRLKGSLVNDSGAPLNEIS